MATSLNTVIVDDQDSQITYSGQWSLAGSQPDYNRTAYVARSEGARMSFTFSGTSVTVVGNLEPGARCNATFSIDGTLSNYTSPPTNTTQRQQTIWSSPEVPEGQHTLVYTASPCIPETNSTTNDYTSSISFDYLLYNTEGIPEGATIFIDDRDQRLRYSGQWTTDGGDGDFRLTRRGGSKGSSVQLAFTGSSVAVFGRVDNTSTVVQTSFIVDGENLSTFSAGSQNSVAYNMEFFKNGSVTAGEHALVIDCLADGPFWLDYILLRSSAHDPTHKAGTIPVGAVVGSVIGVLCLIAIGLIAWIFYFKRRKVSSKNNTLPKRELVRRITRYDSNTPDPFSRDPIPFQAVPQTPNPLNVNAAPSVTSYQSTTGLLAAHSCDMRSVSDTSSSHHITTGSVHLGDDDDPATNLPPEYATTAPSGTNIGYIVPAPSLLSSTSLMRYPPSRTNTFSTSHSSVPSDVGESEISSTTHDHYPPTPSLAGSHYKHPGYALSHRSRKSHGNARFVVNADNDDAHLSIAEMKRRQQDDLQHNPILHTDSGVRLPMNVVDSAYPPSSTGTSGSAIHERQLPPISHDLRYPESSNGQASTPPEVVDPLTSIMCSIRGQSSQSLDDDGQSIAALKRKQHMIIFSPEGFSTQTIPVDAIPTDLPTNTPNDLSGTPGPRSHETSALISTVHAPGHRPPQPTVVDEVPPVYSLS